MKLLLREGIGKPGNHVWLVENGLERKKECIFTPKEKSLLILDSAKPHITDNVKVIAKCNSKLAVIPGGLPLILKHVVGSKRHGMKSQLIA